MVVRACRKKGQGRMEKNVVYMKAVTTRRNGLPRTKWVSTVTWRRRE